MRRFAIAAIAAASFGTAAGATTISPTVEGQLPAGTSVIGGVVLDLIGQNNNRVVSQLAASSLFVGFGDDGTPVGFRGNPLTIGIQTGFDASLTSALGGGLKELSVRITLFDGDTAPGDFDDGNNFLLVNDVEVGNFSAISTVSTDSVGNEVGGSNTTGFADNELDTGFFFTDDATALSSIFGSILSDEQVSFKLRDDLNAFDNFFDFTQGLDADLIDVGSGPVVQPPSSVVPVPAALPLMGAAFAGFAALRLRRRA